MPTIPYRLDNGKRVSGVTTIISGSLGWNKDFLIHWAWKQGQDGKDYRQTTERASNAGTIAHYLIECDLRKEKPNLDQFKDMPDQVAEAKFAFEQSFLPWKTMTKFEVVALEQHMVSEFLEFGATPDCIARVNKKLAIFDWKTSNGLYPEMIVQMAAYEQIWNEKNPKQLIEDGAYMLRIDKATASFHFHHWRDLSKPWRVFLALLQIHNLKHDLKRMT